MLLIIAARLLTDISFNKMGKIMYNYTLDAILV